MKNLRPLVKFCLDCWKKGWVPQLVWTPLPPRMNNTIHCLLNSLLSFALALQCFVPPSSPNDCIKTCQIVFCSELSDCSRFISNEIHFRNLTQQVPTGWVPGFVPELISRRSPNSYSIVISFSSPRCSNTWSTVSGCTFAFIVCSAGMLFLQKSACLLFPFFDLFSQMPSPCCRHPCFPFPAELSCTLTSHPWPDSL